MAKKRQRPDDEELSWIAPELRMHAVALDTLNPDPDNCRLHSPENIAAIAQSLQRFGQDQPLVVRRADRTIIKGNGRYIAAGEVLGWGWLAAVFVDDGELEATARSLADNRSAELARWDPEKLTEAVVCLTDGGDDPTTLGWTAAEVDIITRGAFKPDLPATPNAEGKAGEGVTPRPAGDGPEMGLPVRVTVEQRDTFMAAAEALRRRVKDPTLSEGRCLELICVEWMQDPQNCGE